MKFAIRFLLGGICAMGLGLWWSLDGLTDGWMNQLLGGLVWKGPLLVLAGVGATVMGYRMVREINSPVDDSELRAEGVPVVGWLVQANADLFRPGVEDAPAQLLISFEAPDGEGLKELAAKVGRLKIQEPADVAEQAVAALVRDETYRPGVRRLLPPEFTGGVEVYAVDVWVERRLLPERRLTQRRFSCRAVPGSKGRVYLAPPGFGTASDADHAAAADRPRD